jgi:hypothetical protein
MANDNLNQNESIEKSIHEKMHSIDIKIIALKDQLNELCKLMLKLGMDKDTVLTIDGMTKELSNAQLQLHYYDEVMRNLKLQQQTKPLIIKQEK